MTTLLPPDPLRGVTSADLLRAETGAAPDGCYGYGMWTAAGAARLEVLVKTVAGVLAAGLGRGTALACLRGLQVRLERDGHAEYSDTVVRDSLREALTPECEAAGAAPFTDDELAEVALLLSVRAVKAAADATGATLAQLHPS